jgi:hypothetical protein
MVGYHECRTCYSLQTDDPHWLAEAYEDCSLSVTDTGAVQRNLENLAACYAVSRIMKARNVIDIGGGDGLLCRLLRDYRINCYVQDKYATPTYARGFTSPDFETPDLVIGFEVLEHYANPQSDLNALFENHPRSVLLSTVLFSNQNQDWWYLSPESGQHVFFYSRHAMTMIAQKYGYELVMCGGFILFTRGASRLQKRLCKTLLNNLVLRLLKSAIFLLPAPGALQDHLMQVEQSKRAEN